MPGGHPATPLASFRVHTPSSEGGGEVLLGGGGVGVGAGGAVYTGGVVTGDAKGLVRAVVVGPPTSGSGLAVIAGTGVVGGEGVVTARTGGGEGVGRRLPLLRPAATVSAVQRMTRTAAARAIVVRCRAVRLMVSTTCRASSTESRDAPRRYGSFPGVVDTATACSGVAHSRSPGARCRCTDPRGAPAATTRSPRIHLAYT